MLTIRTAIGKDVKNKHRKALLLAFAYSDALVALVKELPDRRWDPKAKVWSIPLEFESVTKALETLAGRSVTFEHGADVVAWTIGQEKEKIAVKALGAIKKAMDASITDFKFRRKPFAHQRAAFAFVRGLWALNRGAFLALEPGLGKSKIAIDALRYGWDRKEWTRALIVCPRTVAGVWVSELDIEAPEIPRLVLPYLPGTSKEKVAALKKFPRGIVIANYESLWRLLDAASEKD